MRHVLIPLALGLGASAAAIRKGDDYESSMEISAHGPIGGSIGELSIGQCRIGGGYAPAKYTLNNQTGILTNNRGWGCIVAGVQKQIQCDSGNPGQPHWSVSPNGTISHDGCSDFYACPVNDLGEWSVYKQQLEGQDKCVNITLQGDGYSAPSYQPTWDGQKKRCTDCQEGDWECEKHCYPPPPPKTTSSSSETEQHHYPSPTYSHPADTWHPSHPVHEPSHTASQCYDDCKPEEHECKKHCYSTTIAKTKTFEHTKTFSTVSTSTYERTYTSISTSCTDFEEHKPTHHPRPKHHHHEEEHHHKESKHHHEKPKHHHEEPEQDHEEPEHHHKKPKHHHEEPKSCHCKADKCDSNCKPIVDNVDKRDVSAALLPPSCAACGDDEEHCKKSCHKIKVTKHTSICDDDKPKCHHADHKCKKKQKHCHKACHSCKKEDHKCRHKCVNRCDHCPEHKHSCKENCVKPFLEPSPLIMPSSCDECRPNDDLCWNTCYKSGDKEHKYDVEPKGCDCGPREAACQLRCYLNRHHGKLHNDGKNCGKYGCSHSHHDHESCGKEGCDKHEPHYHHEEEHKPEPKPKCCDDCKPYDYLCQKTCYKKEEHHEYMPEKPKCCDDCKPGDVECHKTCYIKPEPVPEPAKPKCCDDCKPDDEECRKTCYKKPEPKPEPEKPKCCDDCKPDDEECRKTCYKKPEPVPEPEKPKCCDDCKPNDEECRKTCYKKPEPVPEPEKPKCCDDCKPDDEKCLKTCYKKPEQHEPEKPEKPEHEEPTHEEPDHEEPDHEEPEHEKPKHEEPEHEEPEHEEPKHEEPEHEEPEHQKPEHQEPEQAETACHKECKPSDAKCHNACHQKGEHDDGEKNDDDKENDDHEKNDDDEKNNDGEKNDGGWKEVPAHDDKPDHDDKPEHGEYPHKHGHSDYPPPPPSTYPPASGQQFGACPADLNGEFQAPQMIVPVSSAYPSKAYGAGPNGLVSVNESTLYQFDIPESYAGKTCSLFFFLPTESDLKTSSYKLSGSGSASFDISYPPPTAETTYDTKAPKAMHLNDFPLAPGTTYWVADHPCTAGRPVGIEFGSSGIDLEYTQDYNSAPIGLYIKAC